MLIQDRWGFQLVTVLQTLDILMEISSLYLLEFPG